MSSLAKYIMILFQFHLTYQIAPQVAGFLMRRLMRRINGTTHSRGEKPLFLQPTPPVSTFTFPLMSTSPPKFFYETFSEYMQPYMVAFDEPAARAQILKDCVEAVNESPLYNKEELPENLHLVKHFSF